MRYAQGIAVMFPPKRVTLAQTITMKLVSNPDELRSVGDFCWCLGVPQGDKTLFTPIKAGERPEYMLVLLPGKQRISICVKASEERQWDQDMFFPTLSQLVRLNGIERLEIDRGVMRGVMETMP